jgi:hypothetical protein
VNSCNADVKFPQTRPIPQNGQWYVTTGVKEHNHEGAKDLSGHAGARKLGSDGAFEEMILAQNKAGAST